MSLPGAEFVLTDPAPPPGPRRAPTVAARAVATVVVALAASVFLLFILAPVVGLVSAAGESGLSGLINDAELRPSIALTTPTATIATLLRVPRGAPLAHRIARPPCP